jgi:hypothetical protein
MRLSILPLSCLAFLPLASAASHNYLSLYDAHDCGTAWGFAGVYYPDECYYQLPTGGQAKAVTTILIENGCHSKPMMAHY